jgi:enoyl-CoA hydratase/carnithine racemase
LVKTTLHGNVALVELNPPTKLIFLSLPLMRDLNDELIALEKNDAVSVVILTGKLGSPSFATGANINELRDCTQSSQMFEDYFERDWFRVVPKLRKPIIAAINGMAFGGGLELAMMCDILIASDNAKMGQPEIKLGVIPGGGGTVRLTQAVGKSKAMEMILTGEPISAQEALKFGLVS